MKVKIFPSAEARLIEIWNYTFDQWSEEQADTYVKGLIDSIEQVLEKRYLWKPVAHKTLKDVWLIRYERHYIFFRRFQNGDLGVISILHESMNIPARLKEDATKATPPSP
jgi:toxin ParE1/3/4